MVSQRFSSFVIGTKKKWLESIATHQPLLFSCVISFNSTDGNGRSILVPTWGVQVLLCAGYVWMQCLTIAYNYRIQGTVRSECSILLICRIFVSALLLLLDCHFEIGCEDIQFSLPAMAFCHYFSDVSVLNVHLIMDIDVKFVYCKFEIILHWTIIFYFNNLQIGCFGHLLAVASRKGLQEKPFHFRFTLAKICQDRMARRQ